MSTKHGKEEFRRPIVAAAAALGLCAATIAGSGPAAAAETTTTFTINEGTLTISAPISTVHLGSKATGAGTIQANLGPVTVADHRGALVAEWEATVSASDFTTGTATAAETIAASQLNYLSGGATAFSPGTGTFVGTGSLVMSISDVPVFTGAAVGNNTATWNPTITVNVPAQAVAGTYTGTITHSVTSVISSVTQ